eukprot:8750661-Alexandrium_andersonii.AAC.1
MTAGLVMWLLHGSQSHNLVGPNLAGHAGPCHIAGRGSYAWKVTAQRLRSRESERAASPELCSTQRMESAD